MVAKPNPYNIVTGSYATTLRTDEGWWTNSPRNSKGNLILAPRSFRKATSELSAGLTKLVTVRSVKGEPTVNTSEDSPRYGLGPLKSALSPISEPLGISVKERDIVVTKAYSELYGNCDVMMMVTLAEADKTVNMIADTARTLFEMVKAIKKGNLTKVKEKLLFGKNYAHRERYYRSWEERWLEYRYGWIPLINDLKGAIALTKDDYALQSKRYVVGKEKRQRTFTGKLDVPVSYEGDVWYTNGVLTEEIEKSIRVRLVGSVTCGLDELRRDLGINDPVLTAWELIPYSFVADWFANIGDYIASGTMPIGLSLEYASVSTKTTSKRRFDTESSVVIVPVNDGKVIYSQGATSGTYTRTNIQRTGPEFPSVPFLPHLDINIDATRAVDAIALLLSAFKGR